MENNILINRNYKLSVEIYNSADVMPHFSYKLEKPKMIGGVYHNNRPIKNALLIRHYMQVSYQAPYIKPQKIINESCIYCGHMYDQFGHFILESLSRVWYIKENPEIAILWSKGRKEFTNWQKEILEILGIKNKIIFIYEPTKIKKIISAITWLYNTAILFSHTKKSTCYCRFRENY